MQCGSIELNPDEKGWYCVCLGMYIEEECELEECVGPEDCPYTSYFRCPEDDEEANQKEEY